MNGAIWILFDMKDLFASYGLSVRRGGTRGQALFLSKASYLAYMATLH